MLKELDNQPCCKATAKIASKNAAALSIFLRDNEDPYDSDSDPTYHFSYFVQDRLEARLDKTCAATAASVEDCDPLW